MDGAETRRALQQHAVSSAIYVSPMSNVVNGHLFGVLVDAIDNAVVANADSVESLRGGQLDGGAGYGIVSKHIDLFDDPR